MARTFPSCRPCRGQQGLARFLPIATIVAAAVLALLPLRVPGYAALTPSFALMAVYHWSVYRPDLLPASGLFAIGFAQDLLTARPVPAARCCCCSRAPRCCAIAAFRRPPFPFVWAGFAALAVAAMLGLWALHCVMQLALFDLRPRSFAGR